MTYATEWDDAKKEFENLTGKSKPKPNGLIAKAFNKTDVSKELKVCDTHIVAIVKEVKDLIKKGKLIAAGKKQVTSIKSAADSYMKVLEDATKDEVADNAGAKTIYAKALKALRTKLDALEKSYEAKISGYEIAMDTTTTGFEKATAMVQKSLISTIAIAAAAANRIKTNPTPAIFDEVFKTSDNVARKVQVQLVQAAAATKKGLIPESASRRIDPRYVADLLTPWQAGGKGEAMADANWNATQVLAKLGEFTKLLKLARAFCDDLETAA